MAAPSYLNVGTAAVSAGATSRAPALPASRTNGNILIAVVGSKNNATHSTSSSGWASLASQTNSGTGFTVSYWWRIVDGTEAAPTISWSGSVACFGQIVQYTRQNSDTAAPFGTIGTAGTGTTSTHTSTGFNSTRNNSLIIYLDAAVANTALATPTNWTERFDAGSTTSVTRHAGGDRTITTSGGSSGNISVTGAAAAWVQRQIEILEPILTGTLSASETGPDTASFTGLVEITGSLAATEAGNDTFSATGDVTISGTLAAQESGSDTFSASGTVEDAPEPEPELDAPQYGGIARSDEDSIAEWLDAVYEARRAARARQEQAAEAIQSAKRSVAVSEAPIDLSGVQAALQALETAIEKAEATAKIRQRRADLEKAANIAVQAAKELRQKREEEDVIFLFLLAS